MTGVFGPYPMTREASGTSWQPDDATHGGIHFMSGPWQGMAHLALLGVYDTQSGQPTSRGGGGDKAFLAGMAMLAARREIGGGDTLNLRAMLSPDPFMGKSGYPLLFATGETANGVTPLDRPPASARSVHGACRRALRHPLSATDSVFVYVGYPGEPALGPPAFMHRARGMDIPSAPITHHWLDSTHITFGVATVGYVHDDWKIELSQFTGREPDQFRFDFDSARFNSTSARLSYNPDPHWSLQASWGHLHSPEQLEPEVDETRLTASATYVTRLGGRGAPGGDARLGAETGKPGTGSERRARRGRIHAGRSVDAVRARRMGRERGACRTPCRVESVSTLALGAIRDVRVAEHWKMGAGAQYAFDFMPASLKPAYGGDPHGTMVFLRLVAE